MLRKENRLRKNRDFQNIQKSGRYYNGGFVGIKVYESDRDTARIGIIAANKIFNNAPERNKARRRVREILRARVGRIEKGQDKATKIRFRSTPLPDQIYFGAVLHENENWSRRCKVYVTDGSIDPPPPPPFDITKWVTIIPPVTPTAHGAPFGVSSVTTFNPTKVGSASDGVTFCEHENDGGNCYGPYRTKKGDVDVKYDPEPAIFPQDTITSIKIQGSYIAVLFAEPSAGGVCEVFTGSHANLRDNPIGMCYCGPFGSFCRDCLSSFIIIPMR